MVVGFRGFELDALIVCVRVYYSSSQYLEITLNDTIIIRAVGICMHVCIAQPSGYDMLRL